MKEHNHHIRNFIKKYEYRIMGIIGFIIGLSLITMTIARSILLGETTSLTAFILIHFAGYLFFILAAVEILYIHMITQGYNPVLMVMLAITTAVTAQAIDYQIGRLASNKFIKELIGKKKYATYLTRIEKFGNPIIFIFNLFPLSSPILILVAGMIKYDYNKVLAYSIPGLLIKYTVLALIFSPLIY
jgi:membrane protein DedA with SNARE-associated domain